MAQADVIVHNDNVGLTIRKIKAGHFLTQATMGPRMDEIDALAQRIHEIGEDAAFHEWIDNQFIEPSHMQLEVAKNMLIADGIVKDNGTANTAANYRFNPDLKMPSEDYRLYAFWDQVIRGKDQLRQRMAWAMYNIFVANTKHKRQTWHQGSGYYDLMLSHAFGNYRDFLEAITYSPIMGQFLSHARNEKGDESLGIYPDENFAREIMQLFSIGVYKTNTGGRVVVADGEAVENYTNEDITNLARVFTGLSYPALGGRPHTFYSTSLQNPTDPMIMHEDFHHQGEKNFLGRTIPAGQLGNDDISDALDILFHYSTTAPFIARRLIQRFTCSTPHVNYIGHVAKTFQNNGSGVRGDFKEILRAILMYSSARDALVIDVTPLPRRQTRITVDVNTSHARFGPLQGRLREPVLLMAHFLRFFEPHSYENETTSFEGYFKPDRLHNKGMVQKIAAPISVFGHYSADYTPTTGPAANKSRAGRRVVLPEFEYLPSFFIPFTEGIQAMAKDGYVQQYATPSTEHAPLVNLLNYSDIDETKNSFNWLINQLNIYMFYGTMSDQLRADLKVALDNLTDTTQEERFANAITVLINSPDFAVSN